MLKPASMKLFYLTFPTKYEDEVLENVGKLRSVQLSQEYTIKGFSKIDNVEISERYLKLQQRIQSILSTISQEKTTKKTLFNKFRSILNKRDTKKDTKTLTKLKFQQMNLSEIEQYVTETESELDVKLNSLEKIQNKIENLESIRDKAKIFQKYQININDIGDFQNIFVKAGFLNNEYLVKLQRYVKGTSIKYIEYQERRKEKFIVITGLNEDKSHIEEALTLLNFEDITFPEGLNPIPQKTIQKVSNEIINIQKEVNILEKEIKALGNDFLIKSPSYLPLVRRTLQLEDARSSLSRTKSLSLMHGWIPEEKIDQLEKTLDTVSNGTAYLKFEEPKSQDNPPVLLKNKGVFSYFELTTRLRGIPKYFEIDPTPITTILFTIMFGMMFGDIGQGAVFVLIGALFVRSGKGFLGIPAGAIKKLGGILFICGLSSMFFGVLYGSVFLVEAIPALLLSPLHDQTRIIVIALVFGVIQIVLGILLNIINEIRRKNLIEVILGGHGIIVLIYYITGVMLAIRFTQNMSLDVFIQNLPLTLTVLAALIIILLSALLKGLIKGKVNLIDDFMMGFGHALETFIAFLTNSISYIRLAAFALAHAALGLSAYILGGIIGMIPSFLFLNVLVILIEGMSTLIQSMRLTYYEFFTKFYSGGGQPYRPFILERV